MNDNKQEYDPGWNDPPTLSYQKRCEITASAPAKRTSLNKRVVVPMGKPFSAPDTGKDPTLPPHPLDITKIGVPPVTTPPLGPPPQQALPPTSPGIQKEEENLRDCLKDVVHNLKSARGSQFDDEINKRIGMMENMWLDNKLEAPVQRLLIQLSKELVIGNLSEADRIQKGLMVDYIAQCSSWMGGIRQLINKIRSSATPEEPTTDAQ